MMDIFLQFLPFVGLGFAMGFITSVSGGGGVFGVPAFLMLGLPPMHALALNRISDIGCLIGALPNFMKARLIEKKQSLPLLVCLLLGAVLGVNVMANLLEEVQKYIIFSGAVLAILLMIFSDLRGSTIVENKASFLQLSTKTKTACGFLFIFLCGIWDGVLAMAGGTMILLVLHIFFDMNLKQARGTGLFLAVPETLFTTVFLLYYIYNDATNFADFTSYGFIIFLSSLVGAIIGSKMMIKYDVRFIRGFICLVAVLIIGRLVFLPL